MSKLSTALISALILALGACAKPVPPAPVAKPVEPAPPEVVEPPAPPPPTREQLLGEYVDKVRRLIRGHMLYKPKTLPRGNPETLVEVVLGPDLRVRSVKTIKPSGVKAFDTAVRRAIEKAGRYPDFPAGLDPAPFQTHKIKYRLHDLI